MWHNIAATFELGLLGARIVAAQIDTNTMRWFTKRAQLTSCDKMYFAISLLLVGFIDDLKSERKARLWYTSLKSNDGLPSFRAYLQIEKHYEEYVQLKFQTFMEENQAELGWTGQFIEPDPGVPDSYQRG